MIAKGEELREVTKIGKGVISIFSRLFWHIKGFIFRLKGNIPIKLSDFTV